jgi:drug/metabolite transporter (DMT)-like permease
MTNSIIYFIIKYISKGIFLGTSPIEIMAYMNIISLASILPFFYKKFRNIAQGFKKHSSLVISIPSSLVKLYCISVIPVKNVIIATFSIPLMTVIMSFIFLGEFRKSEMTKYISVLLGFLGVIVFVNIENISLNSSIYLLLLIHISIHALTNVIFKKISSDPYITLFFNAFFYCIFSAIVLLYYGKFDTAILFSWQIISLAIVSIFCQLCWITGIKITKRISLLQNLEFSKIIFASLFGVWFFNESITFNNTIGGIIIVSSILISNLKEIKSIFTRNR